MEFEQRPARPQTSLVPSASSEIDEIDALASDGVAQDEKVVAIVEVIHAGAESEGKDARRQARGGPVKKLLLQSLAADLASYVRLTQTVRDGNDLNVTFPASSGAATPSRTRPTS